MKGWVQAETHNLVAALAADGEVVDYTDEIVGLELYSDRLQLEFAPMRTGLEREAKISARARWGTHDVEIEIDRESARGDEDVLVTLTIRWPSLVAEGPTKRPSLARRLLGAGSQA